MSTADYDDIQEFKADKRLNNRLTMSATFAWSDQKYGKQCGPFHETLMEVWDSMDRIQVDIKDFEERVWFNGLQKAVVESEYKGSSAEGFAGGVKMLVYAIIARCLITISHPDGYSVTLITEEDSDERRMGMQGIDATEEQARALILATAEWWQTRNANVKTDTAIHMAGF